MIQLPAILSALNNALTRSRVVLLAGPRYSGKSTLSRELLEEDSVNYFGLQDPASLGRLDETMTALRPLNGLVVIDYLLNTQSSRSESRPPFIFFICVNNSRTDRIQKDVSHSNPV